MEFLFQDIDLLGFTEGVFKLWETFGTEEEPVSDTEHVQSDYVGNIETPPINVSGLGCGDNKTLWCYVDEGHWLMKWDFTNSGVVEE